MNVYIHKRPLSECKKLCTSIGPKFWNFWIQKPTMAPMAFKHFTPNFERARTFTFVHVHILDVRERAPPATPTFGCARRNGKRPTILFPCLGVQRTASTNSTTNQSAANSTSPSSTTTTTSASVDYQSFNLISAVHHLEDSIHAVNPVLNLGDVTLSSTTPQSNQTAKVVTSLQQQLPPSNLLQLSLRSLSW